MKIRISNYYTTVAALEYLGAKAPHILWNAVRRDLIGKPIYVAGRAFWTRHQLDKLKGKTP